jgi:hypothetical protein
MAVARAGSDPASAELEIRCVSCPTKFIGCLVGNFGSVGDESAGWAALPNAYPTLIERRWSTEPEAT